MVASLLYPVVREFTNANQDELFAVIQETAEDLGMASTLPASIKEIMDTWTHLAGYPVLRASRINSTNILITQEKFQAEPGSGTSEELWWIPISIGVISPSPEEHLFWISNKENQTVLPITDTEVFVLNPRSEGYFRTIYSKELFHRITAYGKLECSLNQNRKWSSVTQAKLIDDYMTFVTSGLTDSTVGIALRESLCLENETSLIVWQTILKYYARELLRIYESGEFNVSAIKVKLSMTSLLPFMNEAIKELQSTWYEKGEKAILYAELTFWTCFIDVTQSHCEPYVKQKMDEWINTYLQENDSISPFPVDVEDIFFCIAASLNETFWERIYSYMESRHLPAAKTRIANSLMCTTNTKLLQRRAVFPLVDGLVRLTLIFPVLENDLRDFLDAQDTLKLPVKPENVPFFRTTLRLLYNEPARKLIKNLYNALDELGLNHEIDLL